jgi:hypothetical protein
MGRSIKLPRLGVLKIAQDSPDNSRSEHWWLAVGYRVRLKKKCSQPSSELTSRGTWGEDI